VNALGLILLGSIVHATGFALVGILAYLALRRWSPAAGSLAAGSSLVIMVLVSLIVLGPWPRWWAFAPDDPGPAAGGLSPAAEPPETAAPSSRDGRLASHPPVPSRNSNRIARQDPSSTTSARFTQFLGELDRELWRPATKGGSTRWGWPEWLAVAFLASLSLGLARLGLGLWGIARLRTRSQPIDDQDLVDLVEVLRAELGCTRGVAVRESSELATPATIGWRRPLLFLPGDWRDWSLVERRAVLAHELAHVLRGDFLAGLAGQLSLALHFYHPLAHWLAARLRLEQELAADAWGARLSGGKPSYLSTLAQMALRRDSRAVTWPARAFLPSHGTFVRRIEMLRNTNQIRHGSLPAGLRVITVGILVVAGLLVAGLRKPTSGSTALAQDLAQAKAETVIDPSPSGESYSLAFLPADAKMVLAVRPGTFLRRRDVQSLVNSMRQWSPFKNAFLVPPEEIEQLLAFWEGTTWFPQEPGREPMIPPPSGLVLRTSKPQDWKALQGHLIGPAPRESRHAGQTYLRANPNDPRSWGLYMPDDRTLVAAQGDLLLELIDDRNAPASRHAWDEAWKKVVPGQVMLALETRWIRRRIAQGMQGGPQAPGQPSDGMLKLELFSPLLEKARSYAMGLQASDNGLTVDLAATVGSEQDAKPVAETMQAMLTLGKNAVQGMRRDTHLQAGVRGEGLEWILQATDSLLAKARIESSEGFVHLRADAPVDLAEGIKLVVPAFATAQVAARRAMSVNNLKQIGLAFHNYHDSKNRFPSSVNYGGSTGKVPYSWRVAILPYIEQQELYNAYNFDEPWDGPNNRKLLDKMPATYSYPGLDGTPASRTNISYFIFTGPETAVDAGPNSMVTIASITDGTSNTILAVEAQRDIPWTKPEDIPFDPNGPLPELGGFWENGFNALFVDGSVRSLKKSIMPNVLKALLTRAGGEVISSDSY
jgi:prepilin-type processing-associated H-X9-DG protein